MKKILTAALIGMFLMPLAVPQAVTAEETVEEGIVDVGNKMCPIMGGPVNGKDFVIFEGKKYNLCCPGCKAAFLADPAAAIAKMNAQEAVPISSASKTMEKNMEQGHLQ